MKNNKRTEPASKFIAQRRGRCLYAEDGNLAGGIFSLASIDKAFDAAMKGCKKNDDVIEAKHHKEEIVSDIYEKIQSGTWFPGAYRQFETKKEAKRRIVDEPPFRDRVVHHAIKDNVEHMFTKKFIYSSFAVTKGKGQHQAAKLVQFHIRDAMIYGDVYVAQLDIKSYYASIVQTILVKENDKGREGHAYMGANHLQLP